MWRRLLEIARSEQLQRVTAEILPDNGAMRHLCEKFGFELDYVEEDEVVKATITF